MAINFYGILFVWKQEVSEVVSQLPFGRLHRSLKDAFPSAVIGEKCGLYQETRPENPYILISISHAVIEDGRIILQTVVGEEVNLSNRSLTHSSNSIERVTLPVQVPASEEDFGDAVLVGFGSKPTDFGRFQAMCEGIILKPAQGMQVQTKGVITWQILTWFGGLTLILISPISNTNPLEMKLAITWQMLLKKWLHLDESRKYNCPFSSPYGYLGQLVLLYILVLNLL